MATDLHNGSETQPSVTGLVQGVLEDVQMLTTQQFALLKHELKEDFARTREACLPLVFGLGGILLGALLLGLTLGLFLEWVFRPHLPLWVAFAIVTVLMAGVGFALFQAGQKRFQAFDLLPERSLEALKENVQCLTNPK
jgi:hypothetical protein